MTAVEMAAAIRTKNVSPVEVVDAVLKRIEAENPVLNAYCTVTFDAAREAARSAEAALMRGELCGPLHGVPFSIKDVIFTKGVRTTFGSNIYANHVPSEDAPLVERLRAAGGIFLGKTNTPEFGWKAVTDNLLFGVTHNPWRLDRTPGGSSGGAGAAVAAGLGPLAVGTDGGGSIRIPSSCCGIYGLKPSHGRIPTYPMSAVGTLAHPGPMTRTVRDAALMLNALKGPDERDRLSLPDDGVDYVGILDSGIRGMRIGWSPTLGYAIVDPEVRALTESAAKVFEDLGCSVEEAHPWQEDPEPIYQTLSWSGLGARLHALLPEWRSKMDPGFTEALDIGMALSASQVVHASMKREEFWLRVRRYFERFDLLLTPTIAVAPFAVGVNYPKEIANHPASRRSWMRFTYPFNLTGQPAATVPCGWSAEGTPVGLQIVGRRYDDQCVLRASAAFELARPWAHRRPSR
jgi:aspartyl-tRNA(Asn)/glutamyl-tRNA(Gln) amidotransferase subunit A